MPSPSDRERLLRMIDEGPQSPTLSTPSVQVSPKAGVAAPLERPSTIFQMKDRAALVYDRVRAAVMSPEADKRFPLVTATVIVILGATVLFGVDRWRTWSATREVSVVAENQSQEIQQSIGLKLVGVDWSEVPVALIEDTQTGKTHFMRQGDGLKGARVQLIFKDKVIFNTSKGRIALR